MFKPRRKPKKVYPYADRYGEDGRRLHGLWYGDCGLATWAPRLGEADQGRCDSPGRHCDSSAAL